MRIAIALLLFGFSTFAAAAPWKYSWFPGFGEFLSMFTFAFWWELAFVLAAVPLMLIYVILAAFTE